MARPSQRNRQVIRQWEILQKIEQTPQTLEQLALDLEMTARSIRRDLEALEQVFPIYPERHDDGATRWHFVRSGLVPARRRAA